MKKEEIPAALLDKIKKANSLGKGYIVSSGMNKIWHTIADSFITGNVAVLKDDGLWLSGVSVPLPPIVSTPRSVTQKKIDTPEQVSGESLPVKEVKLNATLTRGRAPRVRLEILEKPVPPRIEGPVLMLSSEQRRKMELRAVRTVFQAPASIEYKRQHAVLDDYREYVRHSIEKNEEPTTLSEFMNRTGKRFQIQTEA